MYKKKKQDKEKNIPGTGSSKANEVSDKIRTIVDPFVRIYKTYKEKKGKEKQEKEKNIPERLKAKEGSDKLPKNYKFCFDVFMMLKHLYKILAHSLQARSIKQCYIADEEAPGANLNEQANHGNSDMSNQPLNKQWFPENYVTCFNLFKIAIKALLIILGIGLWRIQEIEKKKRKHIYACQIMGELVDRSLDWEYDGRRPDDNTSPFTEGQISLPKEAPEDNTSPFMEGQFSLPTKPPSGEGSIMQGMELNEQKGGPSFMVAAKGGTTDLLKKILDNFSLTTQQEVDPKGIIVFGSTDNAATSKAPSKEPDGVTPILVAAKRGVTEIVKKILDKFPVAIQDMDSNDKNIVLLAVEHRQPNIYQLVLKRKVMKENVFGRVDKEGNSALHLAATLGQNRPWNIPGAALQMQWEIKWYKFVLQSMDQEFFRQHNHKGQTAREIFTEKHDQLVKDGGTWLSTTSQSCSVVAALIATVAFASATTVPGGINGSSGFPVLENKAAFQIFAISALVALCFSVTSLVMFLAILTSRYQEWDFENDLPVKLILGLTSLFMSIASMLVSFCAGHFFVVEKKLKYAAFPIYAVMAVPVTFFALAQLPLYVDLIKATFAKVPERTEKMRVLSF